jgi:hypothetical protein
MSDPLGLYYETDREGDFIVLGPTGGVLVLVLEVKGGDLVSSPLQKGDRALHFRGSSSGTLLRSITCSTCSGKTGNFMIEYRSPPVKLCDVCGWFSLCDKRRRNDDHLSLVAGITKFQCKESGLRDTNSVARLASLTLPPSQSFNALEMRRCCEFGNKLMFRSEDELKA